MNKLIPDMENIPPPPPRPTKPSESERFTNSELIELAKHYRGSSTDKEAGIYAMVNLEIEKRLMK
jgi:hypothetical protein